LLLCDDRAPITRDFHGNYDSGEEWNGYISDNDRVLLKVVCIIWLLCCLNFELKLIQCCRNVAGIPSQISYGGCPKNCHAILSWRRHDRHLTTMN